MQCRRFTTKDLDTIVELRQAGLKWKEISAQLPERTPKALSNLSHLYHDRLIGKTSAELATCNMQNTLLKGTETDDARSLI